MPVKHPRRKRWGIKSLFREEFREGTAPVYFDLFGCKKEFDESMQHDFLGDPSTVAAISAVYDELSDYAAEGAGSRFLARAAEAQSAAPGEHPATLQTFV
jgi:hypothetical protein